MAPSDPSGFQGAQAWAETDRLIVIAKDWTGLDDPRLWERTDHLIARAKELEREFNQILPQRERSYPTSTNGPVPKHQPKRRRDQSTTSKYWSENAETEAGRSGAQKTSSDQRHASAVGCRLPLAEATQSLEARTRSTEQRGVLRHHQDALEPVSELGHTCAHIVTQSYNPPEPRFHNEIVKAQRSLVSPYFHTSNSSTKPQRSPRPPPGTISSLPFPPLTSPFFGIVQEEVAQEPFWLLVAITFLIKTKGTQAIPTFWKVKERFPTPAHVADPALGDELLSMIQHLGLSVVRVSYLQKYARAFLCDPPQAGVQHRIKKYGKPKQQKGRPETEDLGSTGLDLHTAGSEQHEAWEIGHMTSGKYAIDSWRIFCRDKLLGQAEDWNGRGREPEFQPEWMRVLPDDKELRAYLRWMWMKEGWEWDPATGQRRVLREEMQNAVNQGRVGFDNTGGLKIIASDAD
ncbi:hypothetical protein S7711_05295 [Stachybotrys chartarum IBT 7711]|uniref:HhH-GPD domain-containing protein n=1 Tax=Stachybotrys chartarum (strain CBS 109288 / IBT 7711) TaxID=1280523 RepID=A0A084ALE4_STACB|nr:hypothetical protein S7711_05295 [Stachybotrys chartarum IBT 7711]KFA73328.1 hypothetical protein S40288_03886 [Stachybotrys chartarum IBT 40288]